MAELDAPAPPPPPRLPQGAVFEGLLVLPGPARIDGRVRGEVLAASDLWVGPTGHIEADLEARAIVIEGRVEGDVTATERIELRGSARIHGKVAAPRLAMADGCTVDGACATRDPASPSPTQPGVASP
jgi:cytoskeletal protein CcmA (bactofilin family)